MDFGRVLEGERERGRDQFPHQKTKCVVSEPFRLSILSGCSVQVEYDMHPLTPKMLIIL